MPGCTHDHNWGDMGCDVSVLWCSFSRLPAARGSAIVYGTSVRVSETNVHSLKLSHEAFGYLNFKGLQSYI